MIIREIFHVELTNIKIIKWIYISYNNYTIKYNYFIILYSIYFNNNTFTINLLLF